MIDVKPDMLFPFSPKVLRLMPLCCKQNFVFQLGAIYPAVAGCIAPNRKTCSPQLRDKVLLLAKEQKQ
jgi:hypothetical protein